MENNSNDSAKKLTKGFKVREVLNHPITNHPIFNYDLNIQNIYFTMLCILANFDTVVNEKQNQFLNRLLINSGNTLEIIDFFKKAASISDNFPDEMVNSFENIDLKYNLILDLMLILGLSNEKSDEQIELISETALVLNIPVEQVITCSKIAKSVLEQDFRIISLLSESRGSLVEHFICYIKEYFQGAISFSRDLIYLYSDPKEKIPFNTLIKEKKYTSDKQELFQNSLLTGIEDDLDNRFRNTINLSSNKIIIENYILENEDLQIIIENCRKVEFINCEFVKSNITPVVLNKCREVVFKNCTFKDISSRVISFTTGTILKVLDCIFINCAHYRIIDFKNIDMVSIERNLFNKISFRQLSEGIFTIDHWPANLSIKENKFVSCKNQSGFGPLLIFAEIPPTDDEIINIDDNQFEKCIAITMVKCEGLKKIHYKNNYIDNNIKFI